MDKLVTVLRKMEQCPKRYIGVILGIIGWLLIVTMGFFPTLLLFVFIVIGYALGRFFDGQKDWQDVVERIWQSDRFDP